MFDFEQWNNYCNNYLAEKEDEYNSEEPESDYDPDYDYYSDRLTEDEIEQQWECCCDLF